MGRFTIYNDESVDLQIGHQLETIVKVIVNTIGRNVESIILGGGFGRGEGSIKFTEKGNVLPLKDYDIMVIVKRKPDSKTVNHIYRKAYSALSFSNPEERLFRFSDFVIDLSFTTIKRLKLFPDIATYEFKVASSLLYGKDVRKEIPWEVTDIPLSSGWRLLFEKMTGLIGHFPHEYLVKGHMNQRSKEMLIYECYKTYVEIATALCLLMGCYAPSFSKRSELFKANFSKRLPELSERLPELPDLVAKATSFKLEPRFEDIKDDPLDLWFNVRDDLMTSSKFYLEKFLEVEVVDFAKSHKLIVNKLKKRYFEPIVSAMADNLVRMSNDFIKDLLNSTLQLYFNFKYLLDVCHSNRQLLLKILTFPCISVTVQLHAVAPQVLLSIRRDGHIDESYFESAKGILRYLSPHYRIESFEDLRIAYLTAYKHLPIH